ncbi:MAG: hypothetical protein C7B46_06095 [Sulfobacillus benefaciens]|uniref:RmlD-like substrate binding domain-containing protein n=1 Tax=Sulfobacillus benefaciens TaxID=453960 RepID=A0A2T2XIG4_9FIRM|nr:MAG: hypothetical protein C7B46_06095 [Sulfobacillus benefaciens]
MPIVVLGASGRLGRAILHELSAAGASVIAVSRSATPRPEISQVTWASLDSDDIQSHHALFSTAECVIDARNQRYDDWSGYPAMIAATLTALQNTDARYIYVDNLYLYGRSFTSEPVTEDQARNPVSEKGRIRLSIETALRQVMPVHPILIARFPDFYNISTDSLPRAIRWFGPPELEHQFIHPRDAAHAISVLSAAPWAFGEIWHVVGPETINGHRLRAIASRIIGRQVKLQVLGPTAIHILGLISLEARGLRETQYLWNEPVTLNMAKFSQHFDTSFLHGHHEALEDILGIANI